MYRLFGRTGWGSALIEAQLVWYGRPFEFEEVGDLFKSAEAREALSRVNPLAQVPTLVLPDGTVMTESAAITLLLADDAPAERSLVPPAGTKERAVFLRWLVFLVANIYPTFTVADDTSRWLTGEGPQKELRERFGDYRLRLWRQVEASLGDGPWFLGQRFSALDLYAAVMTRWTPRRPWFAEAAPKLTAIAARTDAVADLAGVLKRNFPG
ncbi:MAG: glutathione S-transferase family protein [Alphaproteobacteria bacterium]|nr:glutathione S-transferase family protein [Alphaproteobacteria bacterium]